MALRPGDCTHPWQAVPSDDQGKIERWHLSLKSRIPLENYYLPGDLEAEIGDLRYHERA
jgi:hypothetical protein